MCTGCRAQRRCAARARSGEATAAQQKHGEAEEGTGGEAAAWKHRDGEVVRAGKVPHHHGMPPAHRRRVLARGPAAQAHHDTGRRGETQG
jgi:hypothetical protein